jgi:TRAP-type C4-dicarboxylate transport system substrate-binding protein
MINRRTTLGALTAAALLAGLPASAQTTWDLSTVWPDGNFHTVNAVRFAEAVEAATNGDVVINVRSGGQLGFKGPEHLRAVRDGLVPMADILSGQQIGDEPFLGIEGIPFLVSGIEDLRALQAHTRPIFEEIAERNNQKILYIVPWPTQYVHMKTNATSVEELQGIRVRGADKNAADMLSAVGMSGILIPWGEVVPALASGAIDGVATSAVSAVDGAFWEFLTHSYATNHNWTTQLVTVNLDAWNSLSAENQAAIEAVAAELEPQFWDASLQADADSRATLEANGMTIVDLPADMLADMQAATRPMMDEFIARVPAAEAPLNAYLADIGR